MPADRLEMRSGIQVAVDPDRDGVRVGMETTDEAHELHYRVPGTPLADGGDVAVAAVLLAAMAMRSPLELRTPVSSRLLGALPRIQEIFHFWDRDSDAPVGLEPVPVVAPARDERPSGKNRAVASFFTAGVDSFFTVLKHRHEIDCLVFVHGFDVPLGAGDLRERVTTAVRQAAAALDKPLVEVETDLRTFADTRGNWDSYHGAALASVALVLAPVVQRIYIPASATWTSLVPWGSHPLLDPLWSTEDVQIVHDGCEATRLEKVRALADDQAARDCLRVCWENRGGAYNCGSCEKCLRTMACLRAVRALAEFPTFPRLDLGAVARTRPRRTRPSWRQTLKAVERQGTDPSLADAIRAALGQPLVSPS